MSELIGTHNWLALDTRLTMNADTIFHFIFSQGKRLRSLCGDGAGTEGKSKSLHITNSFLSCCFDLCQ